jgi:hypothetical protein
MTLERKSEIDAMFYIEMLRLWRFAPLGDPLFNNSEESNYFCEVMKTKRNLIDDSTYSNISKQIGWQK